MKPALIILFLFSSIVFYGQVIPDPRPQVLDKTTEIKVWENPTTSKGTPSQNIAILAGTQAGQTPTPSPEAEAINFFKDISVNLYTGALNSPIPIYTLTEPGGASVPITLYNNSSGMKAGDVAGWVGINNSLVAGGQINRIPRGIPDEGIFTLNNDLTEIPRKGYYQYGLKADNDIENDSQPDLFLLNINGESYKFSFDENRKAHFFPEADIDVSVTWTENYSGVGVFSNWVVKMPDGTIFKFNGLNQEKTFEAEANELFNKDALYYEFFNAIRYKTAVVTAWYLDQISTAFGHNTNFSYHNTEYSFFKINEQTATTINCDFTAAVKKINRVFVESSTLYKIENLTKVVEINKDGWEQSSWTDGLGRTFNFWQMNANYPARTDIEGFSNRVPANTSKSRALHKISVYAKDAPTTILNWNFAYEQVNGNDVNNTPPFGYSYTNVGYTHQRRFKLKTLTEPDGNNYTFTYFDDGFTLPSRFTMGLDHWGLLNGANGNTLMIGEDAFRVCSNGQYANKTATAGWSQYGTLKKISHSTGAETEFIFENHYADNYKNASNQNIIIGGNRIQKITNYDAISGLKTIKNYSYLTEDGQASSGFLCLKPVYHFDGKENTSGASNQYWTSGLYQQLISESGKPAVGYSYVKETIYNQTETDNLGYNVSEFYHGTTPINLQETVGINCTTVSVPYPPYYVTTCESTNIYLRPWKWSPYNENNTGALKRMAVYNKQNQLLSEKTTNFEESFLRANTYTQSNYRSFRWLDKNYNFESSYTEPFMTYRPVSETTKTYSTNGTNPVTTVINYFYDPSTIAKHNQVVATSTIDALGNTIKQNTTYSADFEFTPGASLGGDAPGIKALLDKHILNAVVLSTSSKTVGANTFTTSAAYNNYYGATTADYQSGMPQSGYMATTMPNSAFNAYSYTGTTILPSSDFELKSTINKYNTFGLPKESKTNFGPTQSVVYNASYASLPSSGTSNVGEPSAQTASTVYNKILFGSTTQTATNGLISTSEHYDDGKLKQVKDHNGNIIKHVQYVYKDQADSDPHVSTSTGYNRIITRMPRVATTNALSLDYDQCQISVAYMDGSGRALQMVAYKASPNLKDLVSGLTEYDAFIRPTKNWLSVESDNADGSYYADATYKTKAITFYNDQKPYSEIKTYEASPLSRIFESYKEGNNTQTNIKFAKAQYETATGIRKFTLDYNSNTVNIGTYSTYEIVKSAGQDEKGEGIEEYKDKTGKLLEKRVQASSGWLTTVYIYDTSDRLRYTLTPKASKAIDDLVLANVFTIADIEAWANFSRGVYANIYDERGRIVRKHSVGTGWQSVVYNRMGQAVLSQDEHEIESNLWNYTKYDGQGRTIQTGQLTYQQSRSQIQGDFNSFADAKQYEERGNDLKLYTNRSFFAGLTNTVTELSLKTVAYYDNYSWLASLGFSLPFANHPYTNSQNTNVSDMATGSLHKVDGQGDTFYPSTQYYDFKNRVFQSKSSHELGGINQNDVAYNFAGESTKSQEIYQKGGINTAIIKKEKTLDHVGRSKEMYYEVVPSLPRFMMASFQYDAIGRLNTKKIQPNLGSQTSVANSNWNSPSTWASGVVPSLNRATTVSHYVTLGANEVGGSGKLTIATGGTLNLGTNSRLTVINTDANRQALQTINYGYTTQGQLKGINLDASDNPTTSNEKLFSYKLGYDFDGNITGQQWRTALDAQNRGFTYTYDPSKRLTLADYTGLGAENYDISQGYDENGNISTLQRNSKKGGVYGIVDNLTYGYQTTGDRLQKVDDTAGNNIGDFTDVAGNDYTHYADGKLKSDANKGITGIEYNYLDLVSKVTLNTGQIVAYEYTSAGGRRKKKVTGTGLNSYTIYDGAIQYISTDDINYTIAEIKNEEGRFLNGGLEYGYTDQLGNLRLSYRAGNNGAEITQAQSYDPWGTVLEGSQFSLSGNADNYLITGKEFQKETGYISLDWREYDSILGRMHSPDAIDHTGISAYSYCHNNPVVMVDPDGQFAFLAVAAYAAISVGVNGVINSTQNRPFFQNWGSAAISGALSGGYLSAVGAGVSGHLPSYQIGLGNGFGLSISPALAFGNTGFNLGANIGLGYSSENFSAGIGIGVGYTNMNLGRNVAKGFTSSIGGGVTFGNAENNLSLYTSKFNGAGIGQQVGGVRLTLGGVYGAYENDGAPFDKIKGTLNDGGDRFRTNAVSIGYRDIDLRLNMFTGDSHGIVEPKSEEYPLGLKTGDGDMYRLGALSLGYQGNRIGWNNEGIRDLFQNKFAHTIVKPQEYFRRLPEGYPGSIYTSTTRFKNNYSLWNF